MRDDTLDLKSPDFVNENFEKLVALFPNCLTEDAEGKAIDFDLLKQELSHAVVEGRKERYRLEWPGKREAIVTANLPTTKTLRPVREDSVNFDNTENLYIEGDNLEVLKLLQESYLGKIKMIYIDPPYNTGKDFVYKDNFSKDAQEELVDSGQKDEYNQRLVANPETAGRYHSDWLSMMYPRLKLARNLLKDDGAIFVSCDESEHPRLRQMLDDIFGQGNLVGDLVWAAGKKNDSRLVSISHEYITCYAKNVDVLKEKKIFWRQRKKGLEEIYAQYNRLKKQFKDDYETMTSQLKNWFKNLSDGHSSKAHKHYSHIDKRGIYFPDNISWPGGGGPKYEVLHPKTKKPVKIPSRGWMTSDPKKLQKWVDDDRVHFGVDENKVPCIKSYLSDRENETPYSVFYQDGRAASKRLRSLMEGDYFDFPKDELVIEEIVEMLTNTDDIILDFFAGSSTSAHSILALNAREKKDRKFIQVQLPEETDKKSEAYKAGYKNICEIGKERIRRAAKKIVNEQWSIVNEHKAKLEQEKAKSKSDQQKIEHLQLSIDNLSSQIEKLDTGFRVYRLDSSNMQDVYYKPQEYDQKQMDAFADNVKPDRTADDLLAQVMLDWGLPLSLKIESALVADKQVFKVAENSLYACFDSGVDEDFAKAIAQDEPLRIVFKDSGFKDDTAKVNVKQLLKQLSPETEMKVI